MILFHKTVSIYFDTKPALQVLRRRLIADTPGGRTPSHPAGPTRAITSPESAFIFLVSFYVWPAPRAVQSSKRALTICTHFGLKNADARKRKHPKKETLLSGYVVSFRI